MINKQSISSKIVIFALLILMVFLGDIKYKQWKNQQAIEKQKQTLLAQAEDKQKKNNDLNQSLQYLNSPSFKERVARGQLNLKKDGETIYSFSNEDGATNSLNNQQAKTKNIEKWWNYFFSID